MFSILIQLLSLVTGPSWLPGSSQQQGVNTDSLTLQTANNEASSTHPSSTCTFSRSNETVTFQSWPPPRPSNPRIVPGNFIGFGFETAFLNNYAVGTFSENLVNSIAQRVSEPLIIRSGGTSGDLILFDPYQTEDKICIAGDCPVGSSATFIIGPSYFEGFKRFRGQLFSFQAPLGPRLNVTWSLEYVTRAYAALGPERVVGIALGNEPDLYGSDHGVRYTARSYVNAAVYLQKAIVHRLCLTWNRARIFEAPDLAGYGNFDLQTIFRKGLNRKGWIKYAAEHYYQIDSPLEHYGPESTEKNLMNHFAITSKFASGYSASRQYIEDYFPEISYIISESGSSLGGPPRYYQDSFAAALWLLDFNLYAMSIGVKRVDNTQRPAANHSLWVPDASTNNPAYGREYNPGPQVRAPYFATPMLADFIGRDSGAVVELLGQNHTTAYAILDPESWRPKRIVLVNLDYWTRDDRDLTRGSRDFVLPVGSGVRSVSIRRLHADMGARAQGFDVQGEEGVITWAGETWSYELDNGNGHYTGAPRTETVEVCDGSAIIRVPDSEAVMVTFDDDHRW